MKGTTNPARRDQIGRLGQEFQNFSKVFAGIRRIKQESTQLTQNQLMQSGNMLRYKLEKIFPATPTMRNSNRSSSAPR